MVEAASSIRKSTRCQRLFDLKEEKKASGTVFLLPGTTSRTKRALQAQRPVCLAADWERFVPLSGQSAIAGGRQLVIRLRAVDSDGVGPSTHPSTAAEFLQAMVECVPGKERRRPRPAQFEELRNRQRCQVVGTRATTLPRTPNPAFHTTLERSLQNPPPVRENGRFFDNTTCRRK